MSNIKVNNKKSHTKEIWPTVSWLFMHKITIKCVKITEEENKCLLKTVQTDVLWENGEAENVFDEEHRWAYVPVGVCAENES